MNAILFDGAQRTSLLPLTFLMPVADLRIGIDTVKEKWEDFLGYSCSYACADYLSASFPMKSEPENLWINAAVLPNEGLAKAVKNLNLGSSIWQGETLLAAKLAQGKDWKSITEGEQYQAEVDILNRPSDLFRLNDKQLRADFERLTKGKVSANLHASNQVFGDQVFLEEGAKVHGAILNAETGPIYIAKGAEIMEGSVVRGPLAMCEQATLKLSTKIYGATTVGPHAKVGGEVNNSVIWGYSNKGHDGFLGNSVIGKWCNLGADTNNSNLKNNYGEVKVWSYESEAYEASGLQFHGLIMGDHSKTGINTMLNTGTTVGVAANIFGSGFPAKFVPCFSWGGADGFTTFKLEKAYEVAERMMNRRGVELTEENKKELLHVFKLSAKYRAD